MTGLNLFLTSRVVVDGNSLRKLRRNREITQVQLCKAAGMSIAHYSKIESGQSSCSVEIRDKILAALAQLGAFESEDGQ